MIIFSTSTTLPCFQYGADVPPRRRRIVDDPHSPLREQCVGPLCEQCIGAAGLASVDAVIAPAAAIEIQLDMAREQPITFDGLVRLVGPVCRRAHRQSRSLTR